MKFAISARGGRVVEFTRRDTKILKGIAICLMLCHHLFAFPERLTEGSYIALIHFHDTNLAICLGAFGRICVPMFALLSGYGCYLSARGKVDMPALVRGRLWRLYKTYWTVFIVCLPMLIYKNRAMRSLILYDLIYNFLGLSYSFNGEWWFFLPFAVMLLLFPGIKRFIEREHASLYIDLFFTVAINTIIVYIVPELMNLPLLSMLSETVFYARVEEVLILLPAFMTGCILARYDILSRVKAGLKRRPGSRIAALAAMAAVFLIRPYNNKMYDFINAAVFIIALTVFLPTRQGGLIPRALESLGEVSPYMWLTHTFFCYYWFQRLTYLPRYSPLVFLWLLLMSYITARLLRLFAGWLDTRIGAQRTRREAGR